MHQYLRAVGFSQITNKKQLQKIIRDVVQNATEKAYAGNDNATVLAEYSKEYADGMGITVRGEFDDDNTFIYDHLFPYVRGTEISSEEDISVERHLEKDSYAGICDETRLDISLIFYLQNVIPYLKMKEEDALPIKGTSLTLSALSCQGAILLPTYKDEQQKQRTQKAAKVRNRLIAAARQGDEKAQETLTLKDMDAFTQASDRIKTEDIFSIVDTCFMPYGIESDQYSVLGEIQDYHTLKNSQTGEEVYQLLVLCNDVFFDICINKLDLLGEPSIGRRFKGVIWMQGYINYPA